MRNNALPEAEKYAKLHKRRRVWHKVVGCLACMVVFITTYMLILPAITMEKTAYCGQEEHTHSNACYETRLVCGKEETTETPHTHTDECYEEHKVLVCGKEESAGHVHDENCVQKDTVLVCTDESEEHEHTDECYQTTESYVCGKSEGEGAHTHTDDCYDTERVLICDKEESAVTPHTHTDSCYEKVMVCKKKEHTHQLSCYSNSSADVESASVWERSLSGVKLTGIWADDVISVAESQIGYKESKKNYIVTEDGKTKGYTRYGDWYGNAYGDWCAMFVSFCLNYADIPESAIPYEASCQRWIKATSGSLYYSASDYTPQKGDLIFFDWDNDGHSDHVGLVASVSEDGSSLQTIEGNSSSAVRTVRYNTGDRNIMGYAALPENPAMAADAADENTGEAALDENAENDMAADMAGTYALMTLAEGEDETEDTVSPVNDTDNLDGNGKILVTSISGTGTTYDAVKDVYTSELRIEFSFDKNDIVSGKTYIYTYPEGIIIPDGLLNQQKDLLDYSGMKAGTYTFVKNDDGTYAVQIQFDDSYVQNAGDTISGYVQFKGELDVSKTEDNGSIKLVGSDGVKLNIPADQIAYPADETNEYDIDVSKSGSYVTDGDKLVYTVYVRSYKGTPETIDFSDCITVNGLSLSTPTVTVEQGYRYYSGQDSYYDGTDFTPLEVNSMYNNGKIEMQLPSVKQEPATQNGQELTKIGFYKITYTYDITGMDVTEVSPENKVTVSAEDSKKGQTVSDEATVTVNINKNHSLSKSGWYDSNTGKVKWTITVNANGANIAGAKLTDRMLGDLSSETEITFSPADKNYTVDVDEGTGEITGISFKGIGDTEVNTNTYTITYSTNVEGSWDDQQIKNTANFDPTPGYDVSGDEITTGEVSVNVGGGSVAKSMDGAEIAEDGKTAEVTWTVMLTVPESGLPAGTIIEDDVTQNQWGNANTYSQWMTRGQITAWACNLYWKSETGDTTGGTNTYQVPGTSVVFKASDGCTYDYQQINENSGGFAEKLKYTIFTITLDKDLDPPDGSTQLYFTYKTTVDLESASIGSNSYFNSVKVGDKSAGAEYVYHKAGVKKTDGNNQTGTTSTSSDGTVTWKVVATMDDQNRKKLTLIDTLPDGVTLEKLQLTGWGNLNMDLTVNEAGNISGTDSTNQYNVSGNYTKNTITLDIEPQAENGTIQNYSDFTLTVTCKVNNAEGNTATLPLTNLAKMELDGAEIGSSEQTQNWTYNTSTVGNQVVDKSGAWDNDNRRLNYSIILNPDAKVLAVDADTLSLTDKLIYKKEQTAYDVSNNWTPYNVAIEVTIVQSTVNLYRASQNADGTWMKGEEITGWSWNYDSQDNGYGQITNILSVSNIPDRTPLLLEYAYVVHSTAEDGDQFNLNNISNTAKLENTSYKDSDNRENDQWKEQSSSAGVTTEKNFTLYKVETGNYNNNLAGAVFSVYAYDEISGVYGETAVKTYTTDSNGMLRIQWKDRCYAYNTLYKVVETTPPSGYKLPDVVKEYYFYFSSETDTENSLPTDLPSSAVDLSKTSHTVYAENVKNTTEITVEKKWQDSQGQEVPQNSGSITLELYRKASIENSSGGGESGGTGVNYKYTSNGSTEVKSGTLTGIKVGSIVKITVTMTYNCYSWQPKITLSGMNNVGEGSWTHGTNSIYTCQATISEQSVVVDVGDSVDKFRVDITKISDPETNGSESSNDSSTAGGTLYDTISLNSAKGWTHTFNGLPLTGTDEKGNFETYYYYIKEVSIPNYTTSYENNGGIQSGTITVINKADDNPEITLPETGGSGTKLYTLGGMLLMACAGFLLMYNKKRRKEDMASS